MKFFLSPDQGACVINERFDYASRIALGVVVPRPRQANEEAYEVTSRPNNRVELKEISDGMIDGFPGRVPRQQDVELVREVVNANVASFDEVSHIIIIYMERFLLVSFINVAGQGRNISGWT